MTPEPYLLTPGPLTTSLRTRQSMLRDWGSWDVDFNTLTGRGRDRYAGSTHGTRAGPAKRRILSTHRANMPGARPQADHDRLPGGHAGRRRGRRARARLRSLDHARGAGAL